MDKQHESRRAKQYEMLEATAIDLDDESEIAEVLETSREARKHVAAQRLRDADAALRTGRGVRHELDHD